jgi:D-xylose transport system substrate-binding protein
MNTDIELLVAADDFKLGQLQAKYAISKVPKGKYVLFGGSLSDDASKAIKNGVMSILKPLIQKGDIEVIADRWLSNWSPKEAMMCIQNMLLINHGEKPDVVLAPDDDTAGGVIQALKNAGFEGKVLVTGADASKSGIRRIIAGTQAMTVLKDVRYRVAKTMQVAVDMVNGKFPKPSEISKKITNGKIDVPSILLEPIVVDKSNIDDVIIKSEYLKKSDIY